MFFNTGSAIPSHKVTSFSSYSSLVIHNPVKRIYTSSCKTKDSVMVPKRKAPIGSYIWMLVP